MQALQSLQLETPTADDVLLKDVAFVIENATHHPRYIDSGEVDVAFASDRWKKLILEKSKERFESIDDNWRCVSSRT